MLPESAWAWTFRLLMKLSRSDAAKTGENIKRDKRKRKEKIFFMVEPP